MRLGVNGWRLAAPRTGVARVLYNIVRHWDRGAIDGRFDEVNLYVPQALAADDVPLPEAVRQRVLGSSLPMLAWENLRMGPVADEDVTFHPSYSRPLRTRGPTVVAIYEATLKLYPEYFPRAHWYSIPQLYLRLYEWSGKHATLVLTTTETAKRDIVRGYGVPEEKIRVVPLAPAEIFRPLPGDPRLPALRERYVGADVPYFLFVGKLTPRRNVPKLMEAFAALKRRARLPHRLLVVGLNTTHLDVRGTADALGLGDDFAHVEYVPDEDLSLLYAAAYAFVLPYSYEALSLTAMEAQAAGCPVVTVDTPGLREVTGDRAIYLKSPEVPDLLEALARLGRDERLRGEIAEQGLAFAREFTWKRTAAGTLEILEEAARLPRSRGGASAGTRRSA